VWVVRGHRLVVTIEGLGVVAPQGPGGERPRAGVVEAQRGEGGVHHLGEPAVVDQLGRLALHDRDARVALAGLGLDQRLHAGVLDTRQVGLVDRAHQRHLAPQAQGVLPFVLVRAGHDDVIEVEAPRARRQPHAQHAAVEVADGVERDHAHAQLALREAQRTRPHVVVHLARRAPHAEAGQPHRVPHPVAVTILEGLGRVALGVTAGLGPQLDARRDAPDRHTHAQRAARGGAGRRPRTAQRRGALLRVQRQRRGRRGGHVLGRARGEGREGNEGRAPRQEGTERPHAGIDEHSSAPPRRWRFQNDDRATRRLDHPPDVVGPHRTRSGR
jgi:hypothetical protein